MEFFDDVILRNLFLSLYLSLFCRTFIKFMNFASEIDRTGISQVFLTGDNFSEK